MGANERLPTTVRPKGTPAARTLVTCGHAGGKEVMSALQRAKSSSAAWLAGRVDDARTQVSQPCRRPSTPPPPFPPSPEMRAEWSPGWLAYPSTQSAEFQLRGNGTGRDGTGRGDSGLPWWWWWCTSRGRRSCPVWMCNWTVCHIVSRGSKSDRACCFHRLSFSPYPFDLCTSNTPPAFWSHSTDIGASMNTV